MTDPLPKDFCPYKGLQPYTEADRAFFFGRERDAEIIASNLYASPLTVLYGESGVGKSSVLLAGVVPLLRQTPKVAVVVFRQWQDAKFASMLRTEILAAVKEATGKEAEVNLELPLDEFLVACNRLLRGPVFFIFDQFEEFFLYHPPSPGSEGFDAEWARAVNRQDVDANFLLSLREEGLSRLDRFRGRIPKLLGNMLRLKHLDSEAGRSAIRKPLDKYNEMLADGQGRMDVEKELVERLLDELKTGRVTLGAGRGQVNIQGVEKEEEEERIETPFLQMVLMRLWNEERAADSHLLRVSTLNGLGGAERIIRTHLDKVMEKLSDEERDVAARLFRYLVTPSGTKIAHTTTDLVSYAELPREEVEPVLEMLSAPGVRILRTIAPPPDEPERFRYEIFHDVLAASILDWRRRYTEQQVQEKIRREEQERLEQQQEALERARQLKSARRLRLGVTILSLLLVLTIISLTVAAIQTRALRQANLDLSSRVIAAKASAQLPNDPELSLLLAIAAVQKRPTSEALAALKEALLQLHLRRILRGNEAPVRAVAYSPNGKYIATAGWDNTVRLWDAQTGAGLQVLRAHTNHVMGVEFSPDGKYMASASSDKTVRIWDTDNWQEIARLTGASVRPGAYHVAFNRDSRFIVVAADTHVVICNWTTADGLKNPLSLTLPKGTRTFYAEFSPDGQSVVTASQDSIARIWDWQSAEGRSRPAQVFHGHTGAVRSASFSPDSTRVVTASEGGLNLQGNPEDTSGDSKGDPKAEAKKTAKLVDVDEDWTARIWRVSDAQELDAFRGHTGPVYNAAFSPDGRYVATASRDDSAQIWDTTTTADTPFVILRGHDKWVFDVAFSPDGLYVVTASEDATARIWQINIDPKEFDVPPDKLLALAESRAARQLTPEEREHFLLEK